MIPDKSLWLKQINLTIKKRSFSQAAGEEDHSRRNDSKEITHKSLPGNFSPYLRNQETIHKLEQRIEALETQNDHLLYFIHFLYDNFPDLVKDLISDSREEAVEKHDKDKNNITAHVSKGDSPALTRREIEILKLLVKGLCAKEIANMLYISESTVVTHKKHLKEKFSAKNTAELVSKAFCVLFSAE